MWGKLHCFEVKCIHSHVTFQSCFLSTPWIFKTSCIPSAKQPSDSWKLFSHSTWIFTCPVLTLQIPLISPNCLSWKNYNLILAEVSVSWDRPRDDRKYYSVFVMETNLKVSRYCIYLLLLNTPKLSDLKQKVFICLWFYNLRQAQVADLFVCLAGLT